MIRAVLRASGFLVLAAAFVATVMDGARTLAAGTLTYAKLGETAYRLMGERFLLLQPAIERHIHPKLWDPVVLSLLLLPTSLVLIVVGLGLHRLGRPSQTSVGSLTRA